MGMTLALLAAWPFAARAWGYSEGFIQDLGQQLIMERTQRALNDSVYGDGPRATGRSARSSASSSPLDLGRAGVTVGGQLSSKQGVEKLASSLYPREEFVRRSIEISRLIETFHKTAQPVYGVPPNHLATALAVLLAGAWSAYNNAPFQPDWARPLVAQLDAALSADSKLTQMPLRSKVYHHQLLLGLGLLLVAEQMDLQRQPDAARAARLQQTGGNLLRIMLKTEPSRVSLGRSGLGAN